MNKIEGCAVVNITAMELKAHQRAAIAAFEQRTTNHSLFDMVCGSGKSLIMREICGRFGKVLNVFPTIDLLHYYYKNYERENPNVLIVCSQGLEENLDELAILKMYDQTRAQVTTAVNEIEVFITREKFTILITYASYPKLSGMKVRFDIIAFDEAHHMNNTHSDTMFADQWVFMTATPTEYLLDECKVVYKYNINQAIADCIISDYDIHIVQYEHDSDAILNEHRSTLAEACLRVMKLLDVRKGLSFHRYATSDNTDVNKSSALEFIGMRERFLADGYIPYSVHGEMHSSVRGEILRQFENHEKSIIHNCNLFGEGINSVDLDCVIYIDSKQSSRSIIQALGRALRYKVGKTAQILIPVNMHGCSDIEDAITKGRWRAVVNILKGLRFTDERVMNLLSGRKENSKKLYLHMSGVDVEFGGDQIGFSKLIGDVNRGNWDAKYEMVRNYIELNKKLPPDNSKDHSIGLLGKWLTSQRSNYNNPDASGSKPLTDEQIQKLAVLPEWFWNLDELWICRFRDVKIYVEQNKKLPSDHSKDTHIKSMGTWLTRQRSNYKTPGKNQTRPLTNEQIQKLESLSNFTWKVDLDELWMDKFNAIKTYIEQNKKLPSDHSKDTHIKSMGTWLTRQRENFNNPGSRKMRPLTDQQIEQLDSLQLDWHPNRAKSTLEFINSLKPNEIPKLDATQIAQIPKFYMKASRPNQAKIREQALQKYRRCVLSHTNLPECLDTMHIVPYAYLKKFNVTEDFINHPDNIIVMSKELHALYDSYQFTFDDKGQLQYDTSNAQLHHYLSTRCINKSLENFTDNWYLKRHRSFYHQKHGIIPQTDLNEIEIEPPVE